MKYLLFFFLPFLLFATEGFHQEWLKDYKTALISAKQSNKKLLVVVTTPQCKRSARLVLFTLDSQKVENYLGKNFVVLHMRNGDKFFPQRFRPKSYPASYILDGDAKIKSTLLGPVVADKYLKFLKGEVIHVQ